MEHQSYFWRLVYSTYDKAFRKQVLLNPASFAMLSNGRIVVFNHQEWAPALAEYPKLKIPKQKYPTSLTNVGHRGCNPALAARYEEGGQAYYRTFPHVKDDSIEAPWKGIKGTQMGYEPVPESARFVDFLKGTGIGYLELIGQEWSINFGPLKVGMSRAPI